MNNEEGRLILRQRAELTARIVQAFGIEFGDAINQAQEAIESADRICKKYFGHPREVGQFYVTWHKMRTARGLLRWLIWEFNMWSDWIPEAEG